MACVPRPASCTTACGATGQACCPPGNTCQSGLSCSAGTCAPTPPPCDVSARLIAAIAAALPGVACLPRGSVGTTALRVDVCRAPNNSACGGSDGCAATISWGAIAVTGGRVEVTANVSSTIDVQQTLLGATATCTATLAGPVQVTVPATLVTTSGTTQLTVSGSPSANASGVTLSGCSNAPADIGALLAEVLTTYQRTLEFALGPALSSAVAGASASCP
jgi:hypothetical protein